MKKIFILILLTQSWNILQGQNFPPPTNYYGSCENDSIELFWAPPENKPLSHYNIYYRGYNNSLPSKIDSTMHTSISIPYPTFANTFFLGVSAKYFDPIGESDTLWVCGSIGNVWTLPVEIDFEDVGVYYTGLTTSVLEGNDNWELTDTAFYSQSHCASFHSDFDSYKSWLLTTYISVTTNQTPSLSFRCKIPPTGVLSDTLKLYYCSPSDNFIQFSNPLYSIDDWQLVTVSLESLPLDFHFAFEATSGGGNGVYLDDIIFDDKTVSIQDHIPTKPIFKIRQNPVTSLLTIDLTLKEKSELKIVLYTIDGQPVKSIRKQILDKGSQEINIDVNDIEAGLYVIVVRLDKQFTSRKIVKY